MLGVLGGVKTIQPFIEWKVDAPQKKKKRTKIGSRGQGDFFQNFSFQFLFLLMTGKKGGRREETLLFQLIFSFDFVSLQFLFFMFSWLGGSSLKKGPKKKC